MTDDTITRSCDVLVLGGGIAGCSAAIRAARLGARVLLVCKATTGSSGASIIPGGNVHSYQSGESVGDFLRASLGFQDFLHDQDFSIRLIEEHPQCVDELRSWGVKFVEKSGREVRAQADHVFKHPSLFLAGGGRRAMLLAAAEVRRCRVQILDRVMVTDLVASPSDQRVIGVAGFDVRNGAFHLLRAKAVVIATGGCTIPAGLRSDRSPDTTGDGQAMAFRAGAELRNVEQFDYHFGITGCPVAKGQVFLFGGDIVDRDGNSVIAGLRRKRGSGKLEFDLAIQRSIESGKGAYFSFRGMSVEQFDQISSCSPHMMAAIRMLGYSLPGDQVSLTLTHGGLTGGGGIKSGYDMETSLAGLFVAGDASETKSAGIVRWPAALGTGRIAGEAAWNLSKDLSLEEPPLAEVEAIKSSIYAPLRLAEGVSPREVRNQVWNILHGDIGWFRHESRLLRAVESLVQLRAERVPRLKAGDFHQLMKVHEIRNIAQLVELAARHSLLRKESRYFCQREDYPDRDDSYPAWTVSRQEGGEIRIWTEPIAMSRFTPKDVYGED